MPCTGRAEGRICFVTDCVLSVFGCQLLSYWSKVSTSMLNAFFLQDLKDYVRQAGEVTFADAHKQRKNEG